MFMFKKSPKQDKKLSPQYPCIITVLYVIDKNYVIDKDWQGDYVIDVVK